MVHYFFLCKKLTKFRVQVTFIKFSVINKLFPLNFDTVKKHSSKRPKCVKAKPPSDYQV